MSEESIVFEQVGDIDSKYPYLCVYKNNHEKNPFMEISVNNDKEIKFVFYKMDKILF